MAKSERVSYTTTAQRYVARFPLLTFVGIQINFWVIANLLLASLVMLQLEISSQVFGAGFFDGGGTLYLIATILGVVYGICLGIATYYLDKSFFRNRPLGKVILLKALGSLFLLILILLFVRYVLYEPVISDTLYTSGMMLSNRSWGYVFDILLIYYFFMTLVISFINQVNKKYGPGILIPLLLGRYRTPKEQSRIFLFMDLKSSTATAEKLGHLRYSSFIRDCFLDINEVLLPYRAQIYQYVGDEIVVTWEESEGLKDLCCIHFYFAARRRFAGRSQHYFSSYGVVPEFKAGAHCGKVTAVEIGEVKRDIAYHGDTLNTASRIQSVCNRFHRSFLVSEDLIEKFKEIPGFIKQNLGPVELKGKAAPINIYSIEVR